MPGGGDGSASGDEARRHQRASELLLAALELPEEDRERFVREGCEGDGRLEAEVRSLLGHADAPAPALGIPDLSESLSGEATLEAARPAASGGASVPGVAGYRLVRVLGEGGMGTVYEAEQESPRRRVALKVVRGATAGRETLRRFAREAELLAKLQHPGICQVHEVGRTASGAPYIAMELIDGLPMHEHVRRAGPDRGERLRLAVRICEAVQHAHERGIVHRDLKPDNILVRADGRPKIVDFGIARVADPRSSSTLLTSAGAILGTLSYMSPEQASGRTDIDARADVFSLGVVLFQLLTGRLPTDVEGLTLPQALHVLQQADPTLAGRRDPSLRGDLETILSKALDREPARRYPDAGALASDLRRHLDHEPIVARPPSLIYRATKFTRRHRALVVGSLLAFAALAIGAAVAVQQALVAAREGRRATERAEFAERELLRATLSSSVSALMAGDVRRASAELARVPPAQRSWESEHLEAALEDRRGLSVLDGRVDWVRFTPDGRWLFASRRDGNALELLRLSTGTLQAVERFDLGKPEISVPREALADALLVVAVASPAGRSVDVTDALTGESLGRFATCPHAEWPADRPAALPVLTGGRARLVQPGDGPRWTVCDLETGELVGPGIEGALAVRLLPGGRLLMSADNHQAHLTDVETGTLEWSSPSSVDGASASAVSPDGRFLYTAGLGADPMLRQYDLETKRLLRESPQSVPVGGEAWGFSPSGEHVALGISRLGIALFDDELRPVPCLAMPPHPHEMALALDPGARQVAGAYGELGLRVWDNEIPPAAHLLEGHGSYVYDVAFSPDDRLVASASWDGTVRLWDAGDGSPVATHEGGWRKAVALAWSPDGRRLHAEVPGRVVSLDASSGRVLRDRAAKPTSQLVLDADPVRDRLVRWDGREGRLLDGRTLEQVELLTGRAGSWSPDGRFLAMATDEGLRLLDGETLEPLWTAGAETADLGTLSWRRDSERLAASGPSGMVVLDVADGSELTRSRGSFEAFDHRWSDDGRRLLAGTGHGSLAIWSTETGELLVELHGHAAYIMAVDVSSDGRTVATGSGDARVGLWSSEPLSARLARRVREPLPTPR